MESKLSRFVSQRIISDSDGTIGAIFYGNRPLDIQSPISFTIERPPLNNQKDDPKTKENESSCIPAGDYFCKWTFSNHLKKYTFELFDVPNREGIRIHSANVIDELLGCIAPATFIPFPPPKGGIKHTNGKVYKYYASGSGDALKKLESILPKEGCILSIIDTPKVCTSENQWMISLLTKSSLNVGPSEKKVAIA